MGHQGKYQGNRSSWPQWLMCNSRPAEHKTIYSRHILEFHYFWMRFQNASSKMLQKRLWKLLQYSSFFVTLFGPVLPSLMSKCPSIFPSFKQTSTLIGGIHGDAWNMCWCWLPARVFPFIPFLGTPNIFDPTETAIPFSWKYITWGLSNKLPKMLLLTKNNLFLMCNFYVFFVLVPFCAFVIVIFWITFR